MPGTESEDDPHAWLEARRRALKKSNEQTEALFASSLDASDDLAAFRDEFHFPRRATSETTTTTTTTYLCGNSLGLQPKRIKRAVLEDLDRWAIHGVEGHFAETGPGVMWWTIEDECRASLARIVGASPREVVPMNSLTVNLHLLLAAFYRPTPDRFEIVVEASAFPSDEYAVQSAIRSKGYDPLRAVVRASGDDAESIAKVIRERADTIALVLVSPLQYYTGALFDVATIVRAARDVSEKKIPAASHADADDVVRIPVGLDCAHAVGNVPLSLHDDDVDFACWCSYKYLNAGPGALAGAFVHDKHDARPLPGALRGWWGNRRETRFDMRPDFDPQPGVSGLQLSNPPTLPIIALREALAVFAEAGGISALRTKSKRLTAYLETLLKEALGPHFHMITPRDPARRGAQLSLLFPPPTFDVDAIFTGLRTRGVFVDVRRPDVIRVAPAPIYNSFDDVRRFVMHLEAAIRDAAPLSASEDP